MRIAVLGCGAIGGLFLGYLTKAGCDTTGIVRDYQQAPLSQEGLKISGAQGTSQIPVKVACRLTHPVDLAIFATKIDDLAGLVKENLQFLKGAVALATQNGVRADYILRDYFAPQDITSGIVMFGATYYPPNRVVHNFPGSLILGNLFGSPDKLSTVEAALGPVFKIESLENIKGAKYLKVFINLNNCLPALLGLSMQETFADLDMARLAIALNREAYNIVTQSKITLESLPSYPKERLQGLVKMDAAEAAALFSKIMTSLSQEPLYGSILQSIKRGKRSEIDYINGEIARLAQENNSACPLNQKIVELVHQVEASGKFLTREELIAIK